ncbi:MAG: arsenic transporter, partial [Cyanobacteria bacterium]|nr:arsenic transporter [Cyanobacteriota bacterium]MDW8200325.1 ArsA-related P-loop ATPase [Cyanobacteriota bacterium SKYGB_h_bin112]
EALAQLQIPLGGLVINRLITIDDWSSASLTLQDRYAEQQAILAQLQTIAPDRPLLTIPLQPEEPVGGPALDRLFATLSLLTSPVAVPTVTTTVIIPAKIPPSFPDFIAEGRRLILVGGKGGVGKTTVAAAIAWAMAHRHPNRQIRAISIDPAHSLGDAFGQSLGHEPQAIECNPDRLYQGLPTEAIQPLRTIFQDFPSSNGNLTAQEVDADRVLDQFRDDYLWELADMMSGDSDDDALQIAYGPEAWRTIVAQALPGIDEMLSLVTVMDLLERQEQDLIILDTAPTGHLLRFLEMPTAMGDWLAWIFKLWIKYQDILGHTELIGRLRTLRQRVIQTQRQLKDPQYTEFIGVLQAQTAIMAEAERLSQALTRLGVYQHYLVHNRYEPGQSIPPEQFPGLTTIRLPVLPRSVTPLARVAIAASLLF